MLFQFFSDLRQPHNGIHGAITGNRTIVKNSATQLEWISAANRITSILTTTCLRCSRLRSTAAGLSGRFGDTAAAAAAALTTEPNTRHCMASVSCVCRRTTIVHYWTLPACLLSTLDTPPATPPIPDIDTCANAAALWNRVRIHTSR